MSIAPTIKYFGQNPTTIVMKSSSNFDGTTAQAALPVITPGLYTFPAQAGGGLYNFHEYPVDVMEVAYKGGGTLTINKILSSGGTVVVGTIAGTGVFFQESFSVMPGEVLQFVSSGGTTPELAITAMETIYARGMI